MSEKIGSEAKPEASAAKPRGRPSEKGNPGRPPGSRNRTTRALEQMLEGQAEAITAKVVEMALAGNHVAMRLCMDRLISIPAERSISIELPRIKRVCQGLRNGYVGDRLGRRLRRDNT